MKNKSIIQESDDIRLAVEMVRLGARMQMLEAETQLSRERLLKIYKEVRGVSPPKGMLPFSTDWFMTWQPNIHSSLFMAYYRFMAREAGVAGLPAILKSYRLYLEQMQAQEADPVLSLTRAWTLVRFFDANLLEMAACRSCGGEFVVHAYQPAHNFVCGLCNIPSRAGKTAKARRAEAAPVSVSVAEMAAEFEGAVAELAEAVAEPAEAAAPPPKRARATKSTRKPAAPARPAALKPVKKIRVAKPEFA